MLQGLRERFTRWLFGPPPREDDWEIRYEYIRAYIGNRWLWCAYRDGLIYYASTSKQRVEAWLDQQDNMERIRNG